MFDGPNILLKSHFDHVYTLQDIAIFIFGLFGLKLPIHAFLGSLWGLLPQGNSDIVAISKGLSSSSLGEYTSYEP